MYIEENSPNGKVMTNHGYRIRHYALHHSRTTREETSVSQADRNPTTWGWEESS